MPQFISILELICLILSQSSPSLSLYFSCCQQLLFCYSFTGFCWVFHRPPQLIYLTCFSFSSSLFSLISPKYLAVSAAISIVFQAHFFSLRRFQVDSSVSESVFFSASVILYLCCSLFRFLSLPLPNSITLSLSLPSPSSTHFLSPNILLTISVTLSSVRMTYALWNVNKCQIAWLCVFTFSNSASSRK